MAELATRHAGTQTEIADTDRIIFERIGKVITTLGHGAHEDTDTFLGTERANIIVDAHDWRIETERDLAAVGREMVGDRVLDDLEEFFLGVGGADGEAVQELHHQSGEPLECARDAHRGADFNQDALGGMDIDLQLSRLVDGRIEQREKTLYFVPCMHRLRDFR